MQKFDELAKAGNIREAMLYYVEVNDYVTFVELQNRLQPFIETHGTWDCIMGVDTHILWSGMSEAFLDPLESLIREKKLFFHGSSVLTYMIDGGALKLPVGTRPPKAGYKKPHWLPVVLRTVPIP